MVDTMVRRYTEAYRELLVQPRRANGSKDSHERCSPHALPGVGVHPDHANGEHMVAKNHEHGAGQPAVLR